MVGKNMKNQLVKTGQAAISRETGLEQYEGNEEMYSNILENFAKNNKRTLSKLKDAVGVGDIKLANRIAHSLRGAAGTIGATRLANAALGVENALVPVSGAESDFTGGKAFSEQMVLLEREFDAVFDELKSLVIEKGKPLRHLGVMDREKTIELFNKLAPFLETGDTKCLEYLDDIEEVIRPAAEGFKLFIAQMEHYDFEQAYETMESIRRFITP